MIDFKSVISCKSEEMTNRFDTDDWGEGFLKVDAIDLEESFRYNSRFVFLNLSFPSFLIR
jgi:hypothetical protein